MRGGWESQTTEPCSDSAVARDTEKAKKKAPRRRVRTVRGVGEGVKYRMGNGGSYRWLNNLVLTRALPNREGKKTPKLKYGGKSVSSSSGQKSHGRGPGRRGRRPSRLQQAGNDVQIQMVKAVEQNISTEASENTAIKEGRATENRSKVVEREPARWISTLFIIKGGVRSEEETSRKRGGRLKSVEYVAR